MINRVAYSWSFASMTSSFSFSSTSSNCASVYWYSPFTSITWQIDPESRSASYFHHTQNHTSKKLFSDLIGLIYQQQLASLNVKLATRFETLCQPWHLELQDTSFFIWVLFAGVLDLKINRNHQIGVDKMLNCTSELQFEENFENLSKIYLKFNQNL